MRLKSPIKDVNTWLSEVNKSFLPFHSIFSPGLRLVNYFSDKFSFHSPILSDKENIYKHLDNLNKVFCQSQILLYWVTIIADRGVKKSNVVTAVTHIWKNDAVIKQTRAQTINITFIEAELMTIYLDLISTIDVAT